MATKLGSTTISKLYLGATEVTKAYLGSTEVYSSGAPVTNDAFELTVETTAANETFLLPMIGVTSINVNWGDGTVDTGITSDSPTHTYATAGTHSISVTGSATKVQFDGSGSESKLRTVTNLGALGWTNLNSAFLNCSSMTSFVCGDTDTSSVTEMRSMFQQCSSATTIDVSGFDTSSVLAMTSLFQNCGSLTTLDVSGFDTSSLTDARQIFLGCSSLTSIDVSGWNTSNFERVNFLFGICGSLENLDIDGWDVTSIIAADNFLLSSNLALTTAQYDQVLINWAAQNLQQGVTIHFGDAVPSNTGRLARNAIIRDYGWSITDGDGAHTTNDMFELTVETTAANESFLLPMLGVTEIAVDWGDGTIETGITADNPTHTYATAGTHSISVTGSATSVVFSDTPSGAKLRTVSNLGDLGWTSLLRAFRDCSNMTSFVAGDCDTSNVTNFQGIFVRCRDATTIDVSTMDTSSATTFREFFDTCESLTTVDVSGFNTSSVINLINMFKSCSSLENLDIDGWDVTSVREGGNFLFNANLALTTAQYDAVLIAWAAQAVQSNVTIHFGDAQYSAGGAAEAARTTLVSTYGWTITDGGGAVNNAFELTVETTAANESFLLPMRSVTSIDIDWGDGTVDTGITTDNPTHTYATAGTHSISVTGTAGTVVFSGSGSQGKVRTVTNLGSLGWTTFVFSFRFCSNMTSFDAGDCDTSNVISLEGMFSFDSSLTSLNLSNFDTSNVISLEGTFRLCSSLTSLDVSSFNTSNVKDMRSTFGDCSSLTDVIGVENFNIEALFFTTNLNGFMSGVTLPTSRYDALLINWDAQEPRDGLSPNFGNSKYTAGGAAEAARTSLITGDGWTITDGGSV